MIREIISYACLVAIGQVQAQTANMHRGEYWIDQDLGIGMNYNFNVANTPNAPNLQLPINLSGYSPGIHTIGIRTLDADGHWGLTNFSKAVVIELPPNPPADQVEVEYFLNEDPGFGNGLTAWSGTSTNATGITFDPDMSTAHVGVNTLFVRSRTSENVWSLTNHAALLVIETDEPSPIVRIETFALPASDPGFGMADQHIVSAPAADILNYIFTAPAPFVELGDTLMIRSHDANGRWSLTNYIVVSGYTTTEHLANETGISTYPNPFTEGITVRTEDGKPLRVVLYDPQGRLVHDQVLNGETYIDLQGLAKGTYTAFCWKDLERISRVTLIKQ